MLPIKTIFLCLLNFCAWSFAFPVADDLIVELHHGGQVQGSARHSNISFINYYSFKGIPYAEPPVGPLRLRGTVPHKGWKGIRDATKHGDACLFLSRDGTNAVAGSEDCLTLNVFTPDTRNPRKYAVMVYIYGGGYLYGNGNEEDLNPDLFVAEATVVVKINYRVGFLGFFSTGDGNIPGNYGLKDVLESLRWVQSNIAGFGGDPDRVTIFGNSAGGMIAHLLTLSPLSKGLFHQAIPQSGVGTSPTGFVSYPRTRAFEMMKLMNITFDTTEDLVETLRNIEDLSIFLTPTPSTAINGAFPLGKAGVYYGPCREPEDSDEPRVLPDDPLNLLMNGHALDIPQIVSIVSEEQLFAAFEFEFVPGLSEYFDLHPENFIPVNWNIQPNTVQAQEFYQRVKNLYFDGGPIKELYDYVHFASDEGVNYNCYKAARQHAITQKSDIFFSIFSFYGDLSSYKKKNNLEKYDGVVHADELPYLFPSPKFPEVTADNVAFKVRARMVRLWANFAKYGNPTPNLDELVTVNWQPMKQGLYYYMDNGETMTAGRNPFGQRLLEWWDMDKKYN